MMDWSSDKTKGWKKVERSPTALQTAKNLVLMKVVTKVVDLEKMTPQNLDQQMVALMVGHLETWMD